MKQITRLRINVLETVRAKGIHMRRCTHHAFPLLLACTSGKPQDLKYGINKIKKIYNQKMKQIRKKEYASVSGSVHLSIYIILH